MIPQKLHPMALTMVQHNINSNEFIFLLKLILFVFVDNEMVLITPGIALGSSVVGITPGAALEKKSVRDLAAGFAANKIGMLRTLYRSFLA